MLKNFLNTSSIINEDFKKNILGNMPADYSDLEKAIYIYDELCHRLRYSIEYYFNEDKAKKYFKMTKNLKHIDGIKNKDVVCFTFNRIFVELLKEAELISYKDYICNRNDYMAGTLMPIHDCVEVTLDGKKYLIDATFGVLDNNDLTLCKYPYHQYIGWKTHDDVSDIMAAMQKVCKNNRINQVIVEYYKQKMDSRTYENIPLQDRVRVFLDMIVDDSPDYSIEKLNYIIRLKRAMFTEEELQGLMIEQDNRRININRKIGLLFAYNDETKHFVTLFAYNEKGYSDIYRQENFDSLQLYEIELKTNKIIKLDRDKFVRKVDNEGYTTQFLSPIYVDDLLVKEGSFSQKYATIEDARKL